MANVDVQQMVERGEVGNKLLEIIAAIEEAEAKKQKADLKRNKETEL